MSFEAMEALSAGLIGGAIMSFVAVALPQAFATGGSVA